MYFFFFLRKCRYTRILGIPVDMTTSKKEAMSFCCPMLPSNPAHPDVFDDIKATTGAAVSSSSSEMLCDAAFLSISSQVTAKFYLHNE